MTNFLRCARLGVGPLLLAGLVGCGSPESFPEGTNAEPRAGLQTRAASLTLDPLIGKSLPTVGGTGGQSFSDRCPSGSVATGLNLRALEEVSQIQLVCRKLNLDGTLGDLTTTTARGNGVGLPSVGVCADDQILSGQTLGGDSLVRQVGALCSTSTRLRQALEGHDSTIEPQGAPANELTTTACPAGQAVTGIFGRSAWSVDQLGFTCSQLNEVQSTYESWSGFYYRVSNVRIGDANGPSATLKAGQSFQLNLDYFVRDEGCGNCVDEIIVGLVSSDPAVPQQPLTCVYMGRPGPGRSGYSSTTLTAPNQPGTYTLRLQYGQGFGCSPSYWWAIHGSPPGPKAIVAEFRIN